MNVLAGHRVLALDTAHTPLARFLSSLGAQVEPVNLTNLGERLPEATFLIERQGLGRMTDAGYSRALIERLNPRLLHVSVTTFGSAGPRARWQAPCG